MYLGTPHIPCWNAWVPVLLRIWLPPMHTWEAARSGCWVPAIHMGMKLPDEVTSSQLGTGLALAGIGLRGVNQMMRKCSLSIFCKKTGHFTHSPCPTHFCQVQLPSRDFCDLGTPCLQLRVSMAKVAVCFRARARVPGGGGVWMQKEQPGWG